MQTASSRIELRRDLGTWPAISIVVGTVIGSGIFLVPKTMIQRVGSVEWVFAVWVVGGLLSLAGALSYAELAAALPEAGGEYAFLREAYGPQQMGRWLSFLMVWQIIFSAPLSMASGSIGFANYLQYLAPHLTPWEIRGVAAVFPLLLVALLYRRIGAIGNLSVVLVSGVMLGACGLPSRASPT